MEQRELLKGNTKTIILAALKDGPKHGYRISQWVKETSDEVFEFGAGMLYPLLHTLEKEKLITSRWEPSQNGGPKRKMYSITKKGRIVLAQKTGEWQLFTNVINKMIS